ncbi:MAG: multicopper oxidase domain-containing protein, partial [Verrucomicrobiae bacterium]|nr:multicopper oxidase domain-containing protein [Verrucomicrobiae bacterium]
LNTGLAGQPPREEKPGPEMGMTLPSETVGAGMGHEEMGHGGGMDMQMGPTMGGPIEGDLFKNGREMVVDGMNAKRPLPPYPKLRAIHSTAPDPSKPVREIRLTLDGDMERYVWFLNNKALHEDDQIHIRKGEVVRFVMINRTMMYHPMHLHGQFFRVINGQGDRSPLKHTVTVMPMATTVFEFEASEVGDWFFHCHLLYHMHNGMARVVEYESFTPDPDTQSVRHELFELDPYVYGSGDFLSHMTEGYFEIAGIRYSGLVDWEIGWGNVPETEYEIDLLGNYFHNRFLSLFAGAQLSNNEAYPDGRGIFGFRYPLPLLIGVTGWVDTEGEFRFIAEKAYPLTDRLHLFGEFQYDTRLDYEWAAGLEYVVSKELSITGSYHSEFGVGGGLTVRF